MKSVRKAVRTFLIQDNKVLARKYIKKDLEGYYDVPGGKIEEGETLKDTVLREFREEAGITVLDPQYAGNLIVEYPDRIYDFSIFVATKYKKEQIENIDGNPEFIEIDNLLKKEKLLAEVYLLDKNHYNDLINKTNFKFHFVTDANRTKVEEIK